MRIELQWCQVQAGTSKHLLGDPLEPIDYIETCRIMCIRDFLRTYGLRVDLSVTPLPTVQCENDEFIMDAVRARGGCTAIELQRLNACCMYLQVSRVSDITNADGKFLRNNILVGRNSLPYQTGTKWPRQGRPPKSWWLLWKHTLKGVLSTNGASHILRHPLGNWLPAAQLDDWEEVYSGMSGRAELFRRQKEGDYKVYTDSDASRGRHKFVSSISRGRVNQCPSDSVPASLGPRRKDGRQRVSFRQQNNQSEAEPDNRQLSFANYVAQQPVYISTLLQHADLSDETAHTVANHATDHNNPLIADQTVAYYSTTVPLGLFGLTHWPPTHSRGEKGTSRVLHTECPLQDLNYAEFLQLLRIYVWSRNFITWRYLLRDDHVFYTAIARRR